MSKQISLTLPDEVLRRAELFAQRSGEDVAEVLADAIEVSLDPLGFGNSDTRSMRELSDGDVLAAADSMMDQARESRLADLLDKQRTATLIQSEITELRTLIQFYQEGLLTKAVGIEEAVRRGLRQAPLP